MTDRSLKRGFFFFYEWLSAMDDLSPREYKALMRALIARQRNGTPLPTFRSKTANACAALIELTIKRRLAQRDAELAQEEGFPVPMLPPPSHEEVRTYFRCIGLGSREADAFWRYNAGRGWDCLPDWAIKADLWKKYVHVEDPDV